jgi:hypothetical protein
MAAFPPSFIHVVTIIALALSCLPAIAQGMKGRPIEYSEPPNTEENPILNPKQSRLGSLESELNRPFESINPGRSLDGVLLNAPLPTPAPVNRNPSNKRLDWMYRSAEDLMSADSVETKYQRPQLTPDGRDLNKMRPMERAYYEALYARNGGQATNELGFSTFTAEAGAGQPELSGLPSGLRDAVQRTMQNTRGFSSTSSDDATDFSSFNSGSGFPGRPSPAELRRAQDFMNIYNFSGTPSASEPQGYTTIRSSPYVNSSFYDLAKPQLSTPPPSAVSSSRSPQIGNFAPVAPVAPVSPGAAYTPAPQPARSSTPSSPFMNVTRGGIQ